MLITHTPRQGPVWRLRTQTVEGAAEVEVTSPGTGIVVRGLQRDAWDTTTPGGDAGGHRR